MNYTLLLTNFFYVFLLSLSGCSESKKHNYDDKNISFILSINEKGMNDSLYCNVELKNHSNTDTIIVLDNYLAVSDPSIGSYNINWGYEFYSGMEIQVNGSLIKPNATFYGTWKFPKRLLEGLKSDNITRLKIDIGYIPNIVSLKKWQKVSEVKYEIIGDKIILGSSHYEFSSVKRNLLDIKISE